MTFKQDRKKLRRQRAVRHDNKKYREALDAIDVLEKELKAYQVLSVAPSRRVIKRKRGDPNVSQATAIAMASDWHVDEIVKPSTVQGKNAYNPDVAKKRATKFWQKIVQLTDRNRADTTIDNLLLVLGGDFISSNIHEELLANTSMRPMEAIMFAQDLLDAVLRFLNEHGNFNQIVIICKMGNHSRITKKTHYANRNGNSLEWAMYQNLAKRFPEFKWVIEDSYLTYYTVYDFVIRTHHGDTLRYLGGVGGIYPSMLRSYYQWNLTRKADINMMGHFHSYIPGYNTVNGSLIGYNAFAEAFKFEHQPPIQAYLLLDARRGITIHAPILV
jgi:hypothetical protein